MPSIIRRVDTFYEATGSFAVDRGLAERLFETTFSLMSRYTGQIALNGPKGVQIPIEGELIHPRRINLGSAAHTILLTRRLVDISGSTEELVTDGVCIFAKEKNLVKRSRTIVHVSSPEVDITAGATLISAIHEVGHGFGLEHCQDEACVMYPQTRLLEGYQLYETLSSGNPFRGSCAEDLEIAGYLALADNLGEIR